MNGTAAKLVSYMDGADKRFVIPVYQRNYDWKIENCKQLFDDLVKVVKKSRMSHFFGSIVSAPIDGKFNEYQIIDGQQRLTTISLLMLAMYNLMNDGVIKASTPNLAKRIYESYLIDPYLAGDTRMKLKPVKNDSEAFKKLFDLEDEYIHESNLTINYKYFCSRIIKEEITIDDLYTAITKLEIINISLSNDDNPQLIFESLNSTGLALSEGDKIRNYILMGLPTKEQNIYYEKYWNKIEICTNYGVSLFVRDYLSVKQQAIPSMNKVYFVFKAYVEDNSIETEILLQDLLEYAKRYEILLKGSTNDKELNACIYRLNRLETTVTRPFFLEVLRLNESNNISLDDVKRIFIYTENYLFRRTICDLPTNALNKIFLILNREIHKYEDNDDNYVEKFKYAMLSKTETGRFPRNDEFIENFSTRQVYSMNAKNKLYILERIENYGTIEDKDVYHHCDEGVYSIEHIMPQHLTPAWVSELGPDYDEIHEIWLHRLANLTLTGYNSKYSNSSFLDKRDMENGFIQSGLRMNMWIAKQEKWTIKELEDRNSYLMEKALKIWDLPETNYKPAEKQYEFFTLADDEEFKGRDIIKYVYRNSEQPVTSWILMMEQVVKMLHADDKSVLSVLAHTHNPENELDAYVSDNPSDLRGALQIDQDIYIERNTSTTRKITILRKLFKLYDVNQEDLVFYLKDVDEDKTVGEEGTRYELRRKYWTVALEYIKEEHKDEGCFKNVNPSKFNWISGFIGISGFNITCTANYECARVDLYLGKTKKELNKSAYDYLFKNKKDIENELGVELLWERSEETKASSVSYCLSDASIKDETDWDRMAKFHANWSKKFYDVFVPKLLDWKDNQ